MKNERCKVILSDKAKTAMHYLVRLAFILPLIIPVSLHPQTKRAMEIDDLFRAKRLSDPQLSPDGKWVAYVVVTPDKKANTTYSDIWTIPSGGGVPRRLTDAPKHDRHPRWSPDGQWIAFESNRSGGFQIYRMRPDGSDVRQMTTIATEASQAVWSNDGKMIAFVSAVFPEFSSKPYAESNALNKRRMEERDSSKVKARIMTKLLYRHWNAWVDDLRQHIFVMPVEGGDPRDVTPGDRDAVPTSSTFSAGDDFEFSPDGSELAYTATPTPPHSEAWSTNHDVYIVDLKTGDRKQFTTNPAADGFPRYSPDGRYIAYRAQSRPGFESDRWQLMLYDRKLGERKSLTPQFDSWVESFTWSPDSKRIYFEAEEKGEKPLWSVSVKGNDVRKIVDNAVSGDLSTSANGSMIAFTHQSLSRPVEIYTAKADGSNLEQLTHANDSLFSTIEFERPGAVTFNGAGGTSVQMWVLRPPGFSPDRKYPTVYIVHGGPQGAWLNGWSTRWNPQLWAAQGYVVALPNPRGSTGFGQKFVDEISRDWGGKVFEDLMNGLDYLEHLSYIDTSRMAAAGASFGGYMMNWFQGHTDKFKTIITHDGVYNFDNMYGATDEVWFDEWEHGIPWETNDFDKFSPNRYAAGFKTPQLIIHSENDFRIPLSEAMSLFTTLQRKGIPSKFLYFPDEDHFVLKPQNSELWHKTVFEWLGEYLRK